MATMMSSVRMRAEKEMAMMLMNSTSNMSRAPNMITLPENKKSFKSENVVNLYSKTNKQYEII